jgi:hypothetical protein
MAESGEDKKDKNGETVIIAMDGSEYSDYALQCKYTLYNKDWLFK